MGSLCQSLRMRSYWVLLLLQIFLGSSMASISKPTVVPVPGKEINEQTANSILAKEINKPTNVLEKTPTEDVLKSDNTTRRSSSESTLFPILFNPFDVSHWRCLGIPFSENAKVSSLYTYEVDICFMAALIAKLAFPWLYEYYTGTYLFPQLRPLDIDSRI